MLRIPDFDQVSVNHRTHTILDFSAVAVQILGKLGTGRIAIALSFRSDRE